MAYNIECTKIVRGSCFNGQHFIAGDLILDGVLDGEVECLQKATIESHGKIIGLIKARELVVKGTFNGEAYISGLIYLKRGANVKGKIHCQGMECEDDVQLEIELLSTPIIDDRIVDHIVRTAW
jgi:cytoskeletal protein CcmA (bactofilin family)